MPGWPHSVAPSRRDLNLAIALAAVGVVACAAAGAVVAAQGGMLRTLVGIGILAAPLVVWFVARRPLTACFGLYILLVPIDPVLDLSSFGTMTKLAGMAAGAVALWVLWQRRERVRVPSPVFGWLAVVSFMSLSLIWAIDPNATLAELPTLLSNFALFALMAILPFDRREFRELVAGTVASGVVVGILAAYMGHHGGALSTGRLRLSVGGSVEQDPNGFAAALLLPVAVTAAAAWRSTGWRRAACSVALFFPLGAIYLAASRGAAIGILAMAAVAIAWSRRRLLWGGIFGLALALFVAIPNTIKTRFLAEAGQLNGTGRLYIWQVALQAFQSHWLLGAGFANFPAVYDTAFFNAYQAQFESWHRASHSLIVSTATELGIVGLVIVAVALVTQFGSLSAIETGDADDWTRPCFTAAFVGLLVAALFVDVLTKKYSWLLFGEMLAAVQICSRSVPAITLQPWRRPPFAAGEP